jgi:hypothetical protein
MQKHRISTNVGRDQKVVVELKNDFDLLEILSLKFTQTEAYTSMCSDYGVVCGRIFVNNGFGVPNARVSIFIPVSDEDSNDPVISALYPYTTVNDSDENGYRYNLLPKRKQHGGHEPTGTFPDQLDILTREEVLEVYEKYYKYTVKTNNAGDFMIWGVPVGTQTIHVDVDLSDIGCFSLRPDDFIRQGKGVDNFKNTYSFKSSEDLNSLPQIISFNQTIEVYPFWGNEDLCEIGITRTDFDLSSQGVKVEPKAYLIGSIYSDQGKNTLNKNCRPRSAMGRKCDLTTFAAEIEMIRFTSSKDSLGRPILETYQIEEDVDDDGSFVVPLPMNMEYQYTNEFGETEITNDPNKGIPTSACYRFRISGKNNELGRVRFVGSYLLPNIREYNSDIDGSYAFSLDWNDYPSPAVSSTVIFNQVYGSYFPEDYFFRFTYNKVYTVSSYIGSHFKGGKDNYIGIKDISPKEEDDCESSTVTPPINYGWRRFSFSILLAVVISVFERIIYTAFIGALQILIIPFQFLLTIRIYIRALGATLIDVRPFRFFDSLVIEPLQRFGTVNLPIVVYPECESCEDFSSEQIIIPSNRPDELYCKVGEGTAIRDTVDINGTPYTPICDPDNTIDEFILSASGSGLPSYSFTGLTPTCNGTSTGKTLDEIYTFSNLPINNTTYFIVLKSYLPHGSANSFELDRISSLEVDTYAELTIDNLTNCGGNIGYIGTINNNYGWLVYRLGINGIDPKLDFPCPCPTDDCFEGRWCISDNYVLPFSQPTCSPTQIPNGTCDCTDPTSSQNTSINIDFQDAICNDVYDYVLYFHSSIKTCAGNIETILDDPSTMTPSTDWTNTVTKSSGTITRGLSYMVAFYYSEPTGYPSLSNIRISIGGGSTQPGPCTYGVYDIPTPVNNKWYVLRVDISDIEPDGGLTSYISKSGCMNYSVGCAGPISVTGSCCYSSISGDSVGNSSLTDFQWTGFTYEIYDSSLKLTQQSLTGSTGDLSLGCNTQNTIYDETLVKKTYCASNIDDDYNNTSLVTVQNGTSCTSLLPVGQIAYNVDNNPCATCSTRSGYSEFRKGTYTIIPAASSNNWLYNFKLIREYTRRKLINKVFCEGVVNYSFIENWLAGSLYLFAFKARVRWDDEENLDLNVRGTNYCKNLLYYKVSEKSSGGAVKRFYYRSTKWNGSIFQKTSSGSEFSTLRHPTTIMDLGPRDEFIKEICVDPSLDPNCSVVRSIGPTSFQNFKEMFGLYINYRLDTNNTFEYRDFFQNNGFSSYFPFNTTKEILNGDVLQLISMNSEVGVDEFDLQNRYYGQYSPLILDPDTYSQLFTSQNGNSNGPLPINFVLDDDGYRVRVCLNEPGRLTESSQIVPFFYWDKQGPGFGEGYNQSWDYDTIRTHRLQGMTYNYAFTGDTTYNYVLFPMTKDYSGNTFTITGADVNDDSFNVEDTTDVHLNYDNQEEGFTVLHITSGTTSNPLGGTLWIRVGSNGGWSGTTWNSDIDYILKPTKLNYNGNLQILSTPFLFYFGIRPGKTAVDKFVQLFGPKGAFPTSE